MEVIFKYNLLHGEVPGIKFLHSIDLYIAKGHEPLCVQVQYDRPQLWTLGANTQEVELRRFVIIGTGVTFDLYGKLKYIGTFQLGGGSYIGHVFELKD